MIYWYFLGNFVNDFVDFSNWFDWMVARLSIAYFLFFAYADVISSRFLENFHPWPLGWWLVPIISDELLPMKKLGLLCWNSWEVLFLLTRYFWLLNISSTEHIWYFAALSHDNIHIEHIWCLNISCVGFFILNMPLNIHWNSQECHWLLQLEKQG